MPRVVSEPRPNAHKESPRSEPAFLGGAISTSLSTGPRTSELILWAILIAVLSAAAFGISFITQTTFVQWARYCLETDLFQRDYLVTYFRSEAGAACTYYRLVGHAPETPLVYTTASVLCRMGVVAALMLLFRHLSSSRLVITLAVVWLVSGLSGWAGINSIEATGQLAFNRRVFATIAILVGLISVTRGQPLPAAVAFGVGLHAQALNAILAFTTSVVFLAIGAARDPRARRHLPVFVIVVALFALPFVVPAVQQETHGEEPSLKQWTAGRFINEPDDASLLYSARVLWPEWYALQALGMMGLAWTLRLRRHEALDDPSARWALAVWLVLLAAAGIEASYESLPDYPFVWALQFEFRRMVWLPAIFLTPSLVGALRTAAGAQAPAQRAAGLLGLAAALALPLVGFSALTLLAMLALVVLPLATISQERRTMSGRILARLAVGGALAALPVLLHRVPPLAEVTEHWTPLALVRQIGDRVPAAVAAILVLLAAVAPERPLQWALPRMRKLAPVALALYVVVFFGRTAATNAEGLVRFTASWEGLISTTRLSLAEWAEFLRRYDYYYAARIASGAIDPAPARMLEDAAAAVRRLTPRDALLLVPVDLGVMRGLTERSLLLLEDEDSGWGQYNRGVWAEFTKRFEDVLQRDFIEFKIAQRSAPETAPTLRDLYLAIPADRLVWLRRTYGLTHVLTETSHHLAFAVLYRNARYVVYELP